jgi:hypothetical protein
MVRLERTAGTDVPCDVTTVGGQQKNRFKVSETDEIDATTSTAMTLEHQTSDINFLVYYDHYYLLSLDIETIIGP